jgi:hypothetical protein
MKMRELLQLAWDVLLFRHEAYAQHVSRKDVLKRGLVLLVLVTLLAGVISSLISLVGDLRPMRARQEVEQALQQFASYMDTMQSVFGMPPELGEQMLSNMQAGMEIGLGIEALPTRLPKPVGGLLQNLGAFLSLPFTRVAGWMGYGIWVLLIAKLLGGRATVAQMFGATALFAVPHVLDILGFIPCLGDLLGLVATVWGIAIYVKALAVANDLSIGRAVIATVVPALVNVVLGLVSALGFFVMALVMG